MNSQKIVLFEQGIIEKGGENLPRLKYYFIFMKVKLTVTLKKEFKNDRNIIFL